MAGTIKYLDLTLPSPEQNLALDEALLDSCDAGGDEVLRFWESPQSFVVVGFGRKVVDDVNVQACTAAHVPVLRRCSGGGTVVQGPGCLNYALALRLERSPALRTVSGTNHLVMECHSAAFTRLTGLEVHVEGHTDLAIHGVKFSGNAQRRKRQALLFHGTILLGLDVKLIENYLYLPKLRPEYRRARPHRDFLRSLPVSGEAVKMALRAAWKSYETFDKLNQEATESLVRNKYSERDWNWRM